MAQEKNPFASDTPEWQLFENAMANDLLVESYTADIERFETKRAQAREKAEKYRRALDKLTKTN